MTRRERESAYVWRAMLQRACWKICLELLKELRGAVEQPKQRSRCHLVNNCWDWLLWAQTCYWHLCSMNAIERLHCFTSSKFPVARRVVGLNGVAFVPYIYWIKCAFMWALEVLHLINLLSSLFSQRLVGWWRHSLASMSVYVALWAMRQPLWSACWTLVSAVHALYDRKGTAIKSHHVKLVSSHDNSVWHAVTP